MLATLNKLFPKFQVRLTIDFFRIKSLIESRVRKYFRFCSSMEPYIFQGSAIHILTINLLWSTFKLPNKTKKVQNPWSNHILTADVYFFPLSLIFENSRQAFLAGNLWVIFHAAGEHLVSGIHRRSKIGLVVTSGFVQGCLTHRP